MVTAAQAGDTDALSDLLAAYLPLVYTLVRRGLADQAEVDDVVQETMVRAVRDIGSLRSPDSFRPWLMSIALRQIATQQERAEAANRRVLPLDDETAAMVAGGDVEDAAVTRLDLSHQRRQLVRASEWLDPGDRVVLSLWWLETAGSLTRADLAEALGVSVAHAGVRVQRMREQLAVCRTISVALEHRPRCARLEADLTGWGGLPGSVWRKRLARHVRSCPICGAEDGAQLPPERLLIPFALLPVPFALAAGLVAAKAMAGGAAAGAAVAVGAAGGAAAGGMAAASGAGAISGGAKVGLIGQLTQLAVTHPVVSGMTAAVVVGGATLTATTLPPEPQRPPAVVSSPAAPSVTTSSVHRPAAAAPARTARPTSTQAKPSSTTASPDPDPAALTLPLGAASLEFAAGVGGFVRETDRQTYLVFDDDLADEPSRKAATFWIIAGLANRDCYTFRAPDGRYYRHASWRFLVHPYEDKDLYRQDATFCVKEGAVPDSIRLEASNYPGWFLHRRGRELWVDQSDGTRKFKEDSSFRVTAALTDLD